LLHEKVASRGHAVYSYASGGNDTAWLYDDPGLTNAVLDQGTTATITTPVGLVSVSGYKQVTAERSTGNDTQHVAAVDFIYSGIGGWVND
jgi:hypothetical protein